MCACVCVNVRVCMYVFDMFDSSLIYKVRKDGIKIGTNRNVMDINNITVLV